MSAILPHGPLPALTPAQLQVEHERQQAEREREHEAQIECAGLQWELRLACEEAAKSALLRYTYVG